MVKTKTLIRMFNHSKFFHSATLKGFTIVELLVVIVIIGILATITAVSYTGISDKANIAVMQSDLSSSLSQLKIYQATYDSYPTTINPSYCPTLPIDDSKLCLKASSSNTLTYTSDGTVFNLVETGTNGTMYNVTESTAIAVYVDPWIADWYPGIAATALAGKHIYKTDLSSTYKFKTSYSYILSPEGAIGLDPSYPLKMSLVSPQTNPTVDFTTYPAQAACKAIGGRLPNMQELMAIYTDRTTYGNNFHSGGYWSSTEYNKDNAYNMFFSNGSIANGGKTGGLYYERCVAG